VAVLAFPQRAAPSTEEYKRAAERMDRILDESAAAMRDVSEEEFDATLDELEPLRRLRGDRA
jgi:hypothetical protein